MSSDPRNGPLQFETAEYTTSAHGAATCGACGSPIATTYYEAAGNVVCVPCAEVIRNPTRKGRLVRGLAALGLGSVAAALGAGLYYGVGALTGYEISLVAIVVGGMVGMTVRWSAGGRGGWFYQLVAVMLTYVAIAESYCLQGMQHYIQHPEQFAADPSAGASEGAAAPGEEAPRKPISAGMASGDAAESEAPQAESEPPGLLLVLAVLAIFSLAAPVMNCFESPIGALIVGFGLFQAWSMNRRRIVAVNGPFTVGASPPQPPDGPPPLPT